MVNLNFAFWGARWKWPTASGHVFLAEAVHAIGKAMFPDEWTGDEPQVDSAPPRPPSPAVLFSTDMLSNRRRAIRKTTPAEPLSPEMQKAIEDGKRAREARYGYNAAPLTRLACVHFRIVEAGRSGDLAFATRPTLGGATTPLPPVVWETEPVRWHLRFELCQINPRSPYDNGIAGDQYEYLFVTADSLAKLVRSIAPAPPKAPVGLASAETKCRTWLADIVSASPNARPKSRAAFKAEALGLFIGLSGRSFDVVWKGITAKCSGVDDRGRNIWQLGGRTRKTPGAE